MLLELPQPGQSDQRVAARLAPFAEAAYLREADRRGGIKRLCRDRSWAFEYDATGAAEVLLVSNGKTAVVAIAGSDDRMDWRSNATVTASTLANFAAGKGLVPTCPESRVHTGFATHAHRVLEKLRRFTFRVTTAEHLYLTGHSLGGAAAVLLGCLDELIDDKVQRIATFGAPRPFYDRAPVITRQIAVQRYVDPVPRMPPGFDHAEKAAHYLMDWNNQLVQNPKTRWQNLVCSLAKARFYLGRPGSWLNRAWDGHAIAAYREGLSQWS